MNGEQIKDVIQQLHDDLVRGTETLRRQIQAARDERDRKVEQLRNVCPHEAEDGECKWCGIEMQDE